VPGDGVPPQPAAPSPPAEPVEVDLAGLHQQCAWLCQEFGLHPATQVEITLLPPAEMARIHEEYLAEPGPTDVMAFPFDPPVAESGQWPAPAAPPLLGEILLCPEVIRDEPGAAPLPDGLALRVTHAMLHLVGWDHDDEAARLAMFAEQERLTREWLTR